MIKFIKHYGVDLLLFALVMGAVPLVITGCGEGGSTTTTYKIDGNGTIPLENPHDEVDNNDSELSVTPGSNVDSVLVGDGSIYVVCQDQALCEIDVTIGDGNNGDNNSDNSDNSLTDDNSDHSVTDNSITQLWFFENHVGTCCSCGECDSNVTNAGAIITDSGQSLPDCNDLDFSIGFCNEISGGA